MIKLIYIFAIAFGGYVVVPPLASSYKTTANIKTTTMKEVWKDVPNYEGMYQVSNLGDIKSLSRKVYNGDSFYVLKERILKKRVHQGYTQFCIYKNNIPKTFKASVLVAMGFLNHKPGGYKIVVDHIDNNRLNDNVNNLQLITTRENLSKDTWRKGKTSKYVGIVWHKRDKKWQSSIRIGNKKKFLGYFKDEYKAHLAYQKALKDLV